MLIRLYRYSYRELDNRLQSEIIQVYIDGILVYITIQSHFQLPVTKAHHGMSVPENVDSGNLVLY